MNSTNLLLRKYPLDIPNVPAMPAIKKDPKELGASAVDIDDNK